MSLPDAAMVDRHHSDSLPPSDRNHPSGGRVTAASTRLPGGAVGMVVAAQKRPCLVSMASDHGHRRSPDGCPSLSTTGAHDGPTQAPGCLLAWWEGYRVTARYASMRATPGGVDLTQVDRRPTDDPRLWRAILSDSRRLHRRRGNLFALVVVVVLQALSFTSCSVSHAAEEDAARVNAALAPFPVLPLAQDSYYAGFPDAARNGWSTPSFLPIGTWFSKIGNPSDVQHDKSLGLNTYFHLTDNSDLNVLDASGQSALLAPPFSRTSPRLAGYLLGDELDMRGGPGWGRTEYPRGNQEDPCATPGDRCGYQALQQARTAAESSVGHRALTWSNFGKGVAFWETDQEASLFVNRFASVISTDVYWYTARRLHRCDRAYANRAGSMPEGGELRVGN